MNAAAEVAARELATERYELLQRLEDRLETPMLALGFVWLGLLIAEFAWGLTPWLETTGLAIWVIFIIDFVIKFTLAPFKLRYLKQNWLTEIALLLPALRVFRAARAVRLLRAGRAARGVRLARVITSLNRGVKALGASMGRRGFGYVFALTCLVTLGGAAGMYAFERESPDGLRSFSAALWWTAMIITTMGSDYWPRSAEGRALCLLLALYGFTMFGYVTATLASFFIGRDADNAAAGADAKALERLRAEIAALRAELRALAQTPKTPP